MDLQDDATMSTCNLAKIVHHAWSMQASKKNVDFYNTTTNDFIRTLVQ
jgi:hypothetical protein